MSQRLKITLVKSGAGKSSRHRKVLAALGLKKPHQTVIKEDTPEIRGMLNKVRHLLNVEESEA